MGVFLGLLGEELFTGLKIALFLRGRGNERTGVVPRLLEGGWAFSGARKGRETGDQRQRQTLQPASMTQPGQ